MWAKLPCTFYALYLADVIRIQKFCLTVGSSFDNFFVTYFDVTRNPNLTPLDVLHAALRLRGDETRFGSVTALVEYVRKQGLFLLTVFDEAEKFYRQQGATNDEYECSFEAVGQLYELGTQGGSFVVLCGSSSTLVDLALQRRSNAIGEALIRKYFAYPSLNQQKFCPLVLPLVARDDVAGYLKVWMFDSDRLIFRRGVKT